MLTPTRQSKERILAVGSWDSGKTFAWGKIAEWQRRNTDTPNRVFVLDTDYTSDRSLEQWEDHSNVEVRDCADWETLVEATKYFLAKASPNDFLVLDSADKPWDYVQGFYIEKRWGKEADEFFLAAAQESERTKSGAIAPLADAHGQNWGVINKLYQAWIMPIQRANCHVYACTPAETIGKNEQDQNVITAFGKFGIKPKGQKSLGFQFASILKFDIVGKDRKITTMKERADNVRPRLSGELYTDFVVNYLVPVGGWKIGP